MTTVEADGVTLGVEHLGDAAAPLVLLAGGPRLGGWTLTATLRQTCCMPGPWAAVYTRRGPYPPESASGSC
jgi:hypothetical protein